MKISSSTSGLGDTLLLTSICRNMPNKLTVQLPTTQSRFSILFDGLAQVELCQEKDFGTLVTTTEERLNCQLQCLLLFKKLIAKDAKKKASVLS